MAFLVRTDFHGIQQMVQTMIREVDTYSHLFQDSIANACLDLLHLFNGRSLVKAPDEKVDIAGWSKLLMIVLSASGC